MLSPDFENVVVDVGATKDLQALWGTIDFVQQPIPFIHVTTQLQLVLVVIMPERGGV